MTPLKAFLIRSLCKDFIIPSHRFTFDHGISIKDICIKCGLFGSNNEFKQKQDGIKIDGLSYKEYYEDDIKFNTDRDKDDCLGRCKFFLYYGKNGYNSNDIFLITIQ